MRVRSTDEMRTTGAWRVSLRHSIDVARVGLRPITRKRGGTTPLPPLLMWGEGCGPAKWSASWCGAWSRACPAYSGTEPYTAVRGRTTLRTRDLLFRLAALVFPWRPRQDSNLRTRLRR